MIVLSYMVCFWKTECAYEHGGGTVVLAKMVLTLIHYLEMNNQAKIKLYLLRVVLLGILCFLELGYLSLKASIQAMQRKFTRSFGLKGTVVLITRGHMSSGLL